ARHQYHRATRRSAAGLATAARHVQTVAEARIARVAQAVSVGVGLVGVGLVRTVVDAVRYAIAVAIRAAARGDRDGHGGGRGAALAVADGVGEGHGAGEVRIRLVHDRGPAVDDRDGAVLGLGHRGDGQVVALGSVVVEIG